MLTYEAAMILINMLAARNEEMEQLLEETEAELTREREKAELFEEKLRKLEEKIKKQGEDKK